MPFVVSLTGFRPPARYDDVSWDEAVIRYSLASNGPWTELETVSLTADDDPSDPATRSFTTALSPTEAGWFSIEWLDADGNSATSGATYSAADYYEASPVTVGTLLDQLLDEGGFDVTRDEARAWLDRRHKELVARSKWLTAEVTIASTVADQGTYDLDPDIVDLEGITVSGTPYDRASAKQLWALKAGQRYLRGYGGVYAPSFTGEGNRRIELYPAPDTDGDTISGLAAMLPPDLSDDEDAVVIPADFADGLLAGCIATGLARIDERLEEAGVFEQRFEQAVQGLLMRRNSRVGSGPTQIQIAGYHV